MTRHLDELTLLLYTVKDLDPEQIAETAAHLTTCPECSVALTRIRDIDKGLRGLAARRALSPVPNPIFDSNDPFHRRPRARMLHRPPRAADVDTAQALAASEKAVSLSEQLLESLKKPGGADVVLPQLSLDVAHHRYALLYALQEAGRQSAENPIRIKDFARQTIDWLRRQRSSALDSNTAERMVPKLALRAHAHMLLATASLWTKEFSRARSHLVVAYRSFASGAPETSLALVELVEAQRRALTGEGAPALALARRARETFEAQEMEDYAARASVAEGLAHAMLEEPEEALNAFRAALPVFERHELWSNYIGALNNAATFLTSRGRFEEARRDYARALRRLSGEQHRYWLGYLRIGFAEVLFAGGRFAEAAAAASRAEGVFEGAGLRAHQLIAMLLEVESWARHGSLERARRRLEVFWKEIARDGALDPRVSQELSDALTGANPDYQAISGLRRQIDGILRQRYGSTPA